MSSRKNNISFLLFPMKEHDKNSVVSKEHPSVKAPIFRGMVVSSAPDKTVVVSVETLKTHSKYHKKYRSTKRYQVHDSDNRYVVGDTVLFRECPPMSRHKRHEVIGVWKK